MKTANEILDAIDEVLAEAAPFSSREAEALWAILTALRGPDSYNAAATAFKTAYTAQIRSAAFPKTAANGRRIAGAWFAGAGEYAAPSNMTLPDTVDPTAETAVGLHCASHVDIALLQLRRLGRGK